MERVQNLFCLVFVTEEPSLDHLQVVIRTTTMMRTTYQYYESFPLAIRRFSKNS